ncbi:hypothetical protein Cgig2_006429 [Carnegiea gigantea]|uniref:Uncharacterized protein n=1 Tax=Carnegiea gigantea TaxID=171969 RepID=A0A9Q1JJ43_9CARY|nr:hypothetical protein Cgig2_006429 [Carnegiea gigantea]
MAFRGRRTETVPLRPAPHIVAAQAMGSRHGQPRPQRCIQCTPIKPADARNRSRPHSVEGKLLNDDGPPSVVPTPNEREVPLGIGTASESFMDITTWDYLKKLKYPGSKIIPLVHPILGFGGQEVNPAGVIHLPLHFGDKVKARILEVDFLDVDVPIAYNVNLGRPTLHKVKAVITRLRLMMEVWVQCKEASRRPENAISLASGCW